jgi:hypothetical protein
VAIKQAIMKQFGTKLHWEKDCYAWLMLYRLVRAEPKTIATSAILYLIKLVLYHFTVKPPCFYGINKKLLKRAF